MRVVFEIDMIKANSKVAILFNNEKSMVMPYFEKKIVICITFIKYFYRCFIASLYSFSLICSYKSVI